MNKFVWHGAAESMLRRLWADGRTAAACADELSSKFGAAVSRSAVLGKVHRLGLAGRIGTETSRRSNRNRLPLPAAADAAIPICQRKSILDLDSQSCRWPVGDPAEPNFFFCGAPPLPGKPYCGLHAGIAYAGGGGRS